MLIHASEKAAHSCLYSNIVTLEKHGELRGGCTCLPTTSACEATTLFWGQVRQQNCMKVIPSWSYRECSQWSCAPTWGWYSTTNGQSLQRRRRIHQDTHSYWHRQDSQRERHPSDLVRSELLQSGRGWDIYCSGLGTSCGKRVADALRDILQVLRFCIQCLGRFSSYLEHYVLCRNRWPTAQKVMSNGHNWNCSLVALHLLGCVLLQLQHNEACPNPTYWGTIPIPEGLARWWKGARLVAPLFYQSLLNENLVLKAAFYFADADSSHYLCTSRNWGGSGLYAEAHLWLGYSCYKM